MRRFLWMVSAVWLTTACASDTTEDKNRLFFNDFEALAGWLPASPTLTKEKAHSGEWAIKTDQNNEYSLSYSRTLGAVSAGRFSKVRLSCWVYLTQLNSVTLNLKVLRSAEDKTEVFFQQIDLNELVSKPNQWVQVTKDITFPAEIAPDNVLLVYMWRASSMSPTYLDDLELTAVP